MDFLVFQLPYMTLAINKMDWCGLSNTVHHERLKVDTVLPIEREVVLSSTNKTECFSCKGE